MSDRRFPAASRRSRLFRYRRERPVVCSIASPLMFEETKMPVARLGAVIQCNALHALASAVGHLKREYGELQQLREAVAEAERILDRQQHWQARLLSENPPDACLSLAPQQASAAASPGQPMSPKVESDCEISEARADRSALLAHPRSPQSAGAIRLVSFPTEPFPSIFLKTRER
jgi:hypothetical protein